MWGTGGNDMADIFNFYQFAGFTEGIPVPSFTGIRNKKIPPDKPADNVSPAFVRSGGKTRVRYLRLILVIKREVIYSLGPVYFHIQWYLSVKRSVFERISVSYTHLTLPTIY